MTKIPTRADFAMFAPKRVRYHEVDIQHIVFNANYLAYADIAVTEYFREMGGEGGWSNAQFFGPDGDCMVRHTEIDFLASARADDILDLGARIARIGNSSFTFQVAMFRGNELLCGVMSTYVHFLKSTGRPAPVPESFRNIVAEFESVKPI